MNAKQIIAIIIAMSAHIAHADVTDCIDKAHIYGYVKAVEAIATGADTYTNKTFNALSAACEAFPEWYDINHAQMTIPTAIQAGAQQGIERASMSAKDEYAYMAAKFSK